jgi:hypothetical protein
MDSEFRKKQRDAEIRWALVCAGFTVLGALGWAETGNQVFAPFTIAFATLGFLFLSGRGFGGNG